MSERAPKPSHADSASQGASQFAAWPWLAVFALALIVRLLYLQELSRAPFFADPYGSAHLYLDWARKILAGDWVHDRPPFLSSVIYPYWLSLMLKVSGGSVAWIRLAQAVLGAFNCVLMARLAHRLCPRPLVAWIAGAAAAFYGFLVFEDAELLMAPLGFLFLNAGLLLLLKSRDTRRLRFRDAFFAGLCLGLAGHDRMNLLLFLPVAAWFLGNGLAWKRPLNWKPILSLAAGAGLAILPFTAMNLASGDRVLLSSNAGVNFYIGNNPEATGLFYLPGVSGLDNRDLESSAAQTASAALGRTLKPSEVSAYWSGKAWAFIRENPCQTLALLGRKFLLFWNRSEIPNNTNFYFVRREFAPVLYIAGLGFWLIAPLGLAFLALRLKKPGTESDRLLAAFLGVYLLSILPFFMADRYRLPVVSVLLAYFAAGLPEMARWCRERRWKALAAFSALLAAGLLLVEVPWIFPSYLNASLDRLWVAGQYFNRGIVNPQNHSDDLARGILGFKQSIETSPMSADGHADLGLVYAQIGYYSGAIRELETAQSLRPDGRVQTVLQEARNRLRQSGGDAFAGKDLPRTAFEQGLAEEEKANPAFAAQIYRGVVEQDPYHYQAYRRLGGLLLKAGHASEAVAALKRSLQINPEQAEAWGDLAEAYRRQGKSAAAETALQKRRSLQPGSGS